ncbi:armadillo repeat-containing protein 10-like [Tropilaelaps mercedesae]|uniref:Armadillo repeat-containing protein 10-like n=1 Tax=Tropilaelaps mercedesae TaxID=418985 RepID=A0A1V9XZT0_9ACAR|nr:armadillo repeat-containing protein 10-like [Tropilaelaps mercedesae]
MNWSHLFSASEGLTRTAVIAAFGAGSLYVLYNLLDTYITSYPGTTSDSTGDSTIQQLHPRSVTPQRKREVSGHPPPRSAPLCPLSVEKSIELARQFAESTQKSTKESGPESLGLPSAQQQLRQQQQIEEQADQLTELVEELKYNGARVINFNEVDCLGFLLMANDERVLCETLGIVMNCATFTSNQEAFRERGVLNQVKRLSRHKNDAIKIQALNATSNLCVNDTNQDEFVDEMPYYLELAFSEGCSMISLVALCVLTNMTVKHGSNPEVLKHTALLASKAVCAAPDQSLQAMKILVNVSCEEAGAEHLVGTELREDFFDLIQSEPLISQRCLSIVANLIPKIVDGSPLENRMIQLKGIMLDMWRKNDLEGPQKDQLERALRALSERGWG